MKARAKARAFLSSWRASPPTHPPTKNVGSLRVAEASLCILRASLGDLRRVWTVFGSFCGDLEPCWARLVQHPFNFVFQNVIDMLEKSIQDSRSRYSMLKCMILEVPNVLFTVWDCALWF